VPYVVASEIFGAAVNLFNTTYAIGKDPVTSVVSTSTPFLFHGGDRFCF
jgi:hypothetical protein